MIFMPQYSVFQLPSILKFIITIVVFICHKHDKVAMLGQWHLYFDSSSNLVVILFGLNGLFSKYTTEIRNIDERRFG